MILKDRQIWILASLAFLILLGLLFIQFYWLNSVLEEKWNIIVYEILREIDDDYEDRLEEQYDMDEIVAEEAHPNRTIFLNGLDRIIQKRMRRQDEMQSYEYALISLDSLRFQHFSNPKLKTQILRNGDRKKLGSGKHHYYLYLYIPNKHELLYTGMQKFVVFFILFSLILIGIFAYTLFNLAKQKRLSAMKNDFINNLTHEFKTPIATIDLATKTLKNLGSVQSDRRATKYVNLIKEESTRLENHVDKVLQMSLVDSGNFTLDMKTVDLQERILVVTQSLQLIMQENAGEFQLSFEAKGSE
ncbi:MAG: histidine kinase dimerization/phospho-acceptor domain-containing protein, partial [Bacteroidota bacterium]